MGTHVNAPIKHSFEKESQTWSQISPTLMKIRFWTMSVYFLDSLSSIKECIIRLCSPPRLICQVTCRKEALAMRAKRHSRCLHSPKALSSTHINMHTKALLGRSGSSLSHRLCSLLCFCSLRLTHWPTKRGFEQRIRSGQSGPIYFGLRSSLFERL